MCTAIGHHVESNNRALEGSLADMGGPFNSIESGKSDGDDEITTEKWMGPDSLLTEPVSGQPMDRDEIRKLSTPRIDGVGETRYGPKGICTTDNASIFDEVPVSRTANLPDRTEIPLPQSRNTRKGATGREELSGGKLGHTRETSRQDSRYKLGRATSDSGVKTSQLRPVHFATN